MDARTFQGKYWDWTIPVDVVAMALAAGPSVVADQDLGASGQLSFDGTTPVIRYSTTEHPVRQRFTVAHALGHLMLEHGPRFP
jgi:Zn-dependent peptidase ImmA (M78 family)